MNDKLRDFFFTLPRPMYWLSNEPTNWEYSKFLEELIDDEVPVHSVNEFTATLGENFKVWIANFPYHYGNPYNRSNSLPSRRVRKKLRDHIRDYENGYVLEYAKEKVGNYKNNGH